MDDEMYLNYRKNLRLKRIELGIGDVEVGRLADLPNDHIVKDIEKGKRYNDASVIIAVAHALNSTVMEMVQPCPEDYFYDLDQVHNFKINLEMYRITHGLSMAAMSKLVGYQNIGSYRTLITLPDLVPYPQTVYRICHSLGIPVGVLMEGD